METNAVRWKPAESFVGSGVGGVCHAEVNTDSNECEGTTTEQLLLNSTITADTRKPKRRYVSD